MRLPPVFPRSAKRRVSTSVGPTGRILPASSAFDDAQRLLDVSKIRRRQQVVFHPKTCHLISPQKIYKHTSALLRNPRDNGSMNAAPLSSELRPRRPTCGQADQQAKQRDSIGASAKDWKPVSPEPSSALPGTPTSATGSTITSMSASTPGDEGTAGGRDNRVHRWGQRLLLRVVAPGSAATRSQHEPRRRRHSRNPRYQVVAEIFAQTTRAMTLPQPRRIIRQRHCSQYVSFVVTKNQAPRNRILRGWVRRGCTTAANTPATSTAGKKRDSKVSWN